MSPRAILLILAGVLVAAGLFLGLRTISAGGVECGSVLSPSSEAAEMADMGEEIAGTLEGATPDDELNSNQSSCDSAVGDAKPLAYGALGLGVLALLLSFVVPAAGSRRTT